MIEMASGEYTFEVNSNGEIVIPAEVTEELLLKKGAKVAGKKQANRLILQPAANPVHPLRGMSKGAGAYREREHRKETLRGMKRFVLDASSVLRFTDNEAGADRIQELIELAEQGAVQLYISPVNWER
jgi:bifunctional DNA-binding transcriptional regulator/antitoxin component of YhaV-PrlF toxin-antitoxin module